MANFHALTKIATDLNNLDDKKVVKVAGVVQRLRSWYKSLFDSQYKNDVRKMRDESQTIKVYLDELSKMIDKFESSISNGNIDSYNFAVDRIKMIASELDKAMGQYAQTAQNAEAPEEAKAPQGGDSFRDPSLSGIQKVYFTDRMKASPRVQATLVNAIANSGYDKSEAEEIARDPETFTAIEQAIAEGQIIGSESVPDTSDGRSRAGEMLVYVQTQPFNIPGRPLSLQLVAVVVDLSQRLNTPRPIMAVKRIHSIKARKKEALKNNNITKNAATIGAISGLEKKSSAFKNKLIEVAEAVGTKPEYIAAVMHNESGMNPQAVNPLNTKISTDGGKTFQTLQSFSRKHGKDKSNEVINTLAQGGKDELAEKGIVIKPGATGLIQFMPSTAKGYGTSVDELLQMSDVEQLDFVQKHFANFRGRINSPGDAYMSVFLPKFVGHSSDTVIGQKGNKDLLSKGLTYDDVYKYNYGFDRDKDGIIRIKDVAGKAISTYNASLNKKAIDVDSDPVGFGSVDKEVQELANYLGVSLAKPLTSIVKEAILNDSLPTSKVTLKLSSNDRSGTLLYAYTLSNALGSTLDADTYVCSDGDKVEVCCETQGNIETVAGAITGVKNIVNAAFDNKYNGFSVKSKILLNKISSFSVVNDSDLLKEKRKFIIKRVNHVV